MRCARYSLIYERALATGGPRETLYWAGLLYGQWETRAVAHVLALVVAKENEFKLGDAQIALRLRAVLASNQLSAYGLRRDTALMCSPSCLSPRGRLYDMYSRIFAVFFVICICLERNARR